MENGMEACTVETEIPKEVVNGDEVLPEMPAEIVPAVPVVDETVSEVPTAPLPEKILTAEVKSPVLAGLLTWLHNDAPLSPERLAELRIEHADFETALRVVQPSAKREGFATVPDVTWDDIGSLQNIRQELQMTILVRQQYFLHRYSVVPTR